MAERDSVPFIDKVKASPYARAALGYAVLSVIVTWPLITKMGSLVIGTVTPSPDLEGTIWVHWWVKHAVLSGKPMTFCPLIYYPVGKDMLLHIGSGFEGLLALPFLVLFGFPVYYNVLCLAIMIFNGVAAFALLRYVAKDDLVAFVIGMVVVFNSYFFREIADGHIITVILGLPALYFLFLAKLLEEDRRSNIVWCAVTLLLTALLYWFYAIFLVTATVPIIAVYMFIERHRVNLKALAIRMAAVFGLFLIIVLPFVAPFIKQIIAAKGLPGMSFFQSYPLLMDILPMQPSQDPRKLTLVNSVSLDGELGLYPWILVIFGVVVPLFRLKASGWHWLVAMFCMFSLALGPYLNLGGDFQDVRMPFFFFYKFVPLWSRLTFPSRIMGVVVILMGILAARNLAWLFEMLKEKSQKIPSALTVILVLVTLVELSSVKAQTPVGLRSLSIPSFFSTLARENDCAVIELPFLVCSKTCLYQTVHRKKLMGGPGEAAHWLLSPDFVNFYKGNSFLLYLEDLNNSISAYATYNEADVEALKAIGYKYIIVYRDYMGEVSLRTLGYDTYESEELISTRILNAMEARFGDPVYSGEGMTVYDMSGKGRREDMWPPRQQR